MITPLLSRVAWEKEWYQINARASYMASYLPLDHDKTGNFRFLEIF